jgi:uncharacterized repeat protein (TIGR03803 family)
VFGLNGRKKLRCFFVGGVAGAIALCFCPTLRAQFNTAASTSTHSTNRPDLQTLVHFNSRLGTHPRAGLLQSSDGMLYGTTYDGGNHQRGTIFRVSPTGQLTTLVHFEGQNGAYPLAELIQASDGHFYGTTTQGGPRNQGTLFRLTQAGELTTLVRFGGRQGIYPSGPLVEGTNQVLYGTTQKGGNLNRCLDGCGTVFRVGFKGGLYTLLEFNGLNGAMPLAGVTLDPEGILWGTTFKGGLNRVGSIFKLNPKGGFKKIITFNVFNGAHPVGQLTLMKDRETYAFYGVTQTGGNNGQGTLFRLMPSGQLTSLFHFDGNTGANPDAGMILASNGILYGTTANGASHYAGGVYQWSGKNAFRVFRIFHPRNGAMPRGVLVEGTDGFLYGTTEGGGQYSLGTIFRFKPG